MYLMETALGQYSQLGPMSVWSMAPIMKGECLLGDQKALTSSKNGFKMYALDEISVPDLCVVNLCNQLGS